MLYYAFDDNFSGVTGEGYFGKAGEDAVNQAVAIMNSLPKVDNIDPSTYPFQSQSFNPTARNLYLMDLKSTTLHLLVEQLGLTEPERYTWTLHDRSVGPNCPVTTGYLVVQRNFNPIPSSLSQVQYSTYVNNVLYTYFIEEDCAKIPGIPWDAITVPHGQDPTAELYTSVAANNEAGSLGNEGAIDPSTDQVLIYNGGLQIGGFYTGLTYDDVGGLKYLMSTNNIIYETPAAGSGLISVTSAGVTNLSPSFLLYTSNYNAFWWSARTNSPATLSNLYPGLIILSSTILLHQHCHTQSVRLFNQPDWRAGGQSADTGDCDQRLYPHLSGHLLGHFCQRGHQCLPCQHQRPVGDDHGGPPDRRAGGQPVGHQHHDHIRQPGQYALGGILHQHQLPLRPD